VRPRKYVTTEQVQQAVPVRREQARVEREPISDANIGAVTSGPEISEEEHEVVLREDSSNGSRTERFEEQRDGFGQAMGWSVGLTSPVIRGLQQ
jgi:stress response protein YsnF